MIYRITFGFRGKGQGWSETHSMLNASSNPNDLKPTLRDIAQKRANFLGAPFEIIAVRIARYYDEAAGVRSRGSALIKETFVSQNPQVTGPAEPADVALIARGTPNTVGNPALAAFNGNSNQTFLGGPSDAAVTDAGTVLLGAAGLGAAFASWRGAMLAASMGWITVARADLVPIDTVTALVSGRASYTLSRPAVPDPTGKRMTVRVSGVNNGRSALNGPQLVQFTDADTAVTVQPRAFAGTPVGGQMRVYLTTPVHLSYLDIVLELVTGQHDRGQPFGSSRGRQPRIPRA